MNISYLKAILLGLILSLSLTITGCGSSSDSNPIVSGSTSSGGNPSGSGSTGNNAGGTTNDTGGSTTNNSVSDGVEGPLDQIQTPLSEDVFGQLVGATAGTPLEGTLDCAGQAVVIDVIDVVDSIALALMQAAESQDPAAALEGAAANIQFSLEELAVDLPGALTALAGDDCNVEAGTGTGGAGSNPLAGTPLAPLGDALAPVLGQLPAAGGSSGGDLDLQSLSALMHELSTAFSGGLAQVPAEAADAPIFGGLLTTLDTAFSDLDGTMLHLGVYNGTATAESLEVTLNNLLKNILTEVIPVNFIEAQAGQPGVFSGPINDGVDQATAALGDNLLAGVLPPLTDALNGPLAVLLDPVENQLLPAILGPITDGLAGAAGGTGGATGTPLDGLLGQLTGLLGGDTGGASGPTGTPLDLLLGPITDALAGGTAGGAGPTGTPLDLILGPLLDAAGGTGGACPLAGTPLEPVCAAIDAIPAP